MLGYKELNWNLGCPYPMVVNRCMGSGLISHPARIDGILKRIHEEIHEDVLARRDADCLLMGETLETLQNAIIKPLGGLTE